MLAQGVLQQTTNDPTEPELRGYLGDVVLSGMATTEGELFEGSVALSVPVFREDGIVGAIALLGPAFRCDPAWRARAGTMLQAAARTINAGLAEPG